MGYGSEERLLAIRCDNAVEFSNAYAVRGRSAETLGLQEIEILWCPERPRPSNIETRLWNKAFPKLGNRQCHATVGQLAGERVGGAPRRFLT
jgi:hypothetical protein